MAAMAQQWPWMTLEVIHMHSGTTAIYGLSNGSNGIDLESLHQLQVFSNAIHQTFVQHFTWFQLTVCSHGSSVLAELLVCIGDSQIQFQKTFTFYLPEIVTRYLWWIFILAVRWPSEDIYMVFAFICQNSIRSISNHFLTVKQSTNERHALERKKYVKQSMSAATE